MRSTRAAAAILSGLCVFGAALATAAPASAAKTAERSEVGIVETQAASFRLYVRATGRCLINSGGSISGTFTGSCTTGGNRYWYGVADVGGGRIVNSGTGRCLTASSNGSVWTAPCNGSGSQVWMRTGLGLVQNSGLGKCLQGATAGGGVTLNPCNQSSTYQQWGQFDY
ncbi:RICIN domain-containing protein [Nonomuraea sp. B5E05]|uniref:RICIN domain-containing protein n=1 Tax=Nonomuraea sp. B5E05 TaxID=3153569 RepID=UPI003261B513